MKKFSVKSIVAIGIGAALFFVLGRFVAIPSPVPTVNICVQYGLLVGLATKLLKISEAEMGKKGLIKFNIAQVVSHVICWGAVAPVLDILMYNEPLDKLFAQGLVSGISNAVTTAIVGSLLCVAYAATKTKAGSLTKE